LVPTTAGPVALLRREDLGFHQAATLKKDGLAWFPNQVVLGLVYAGPVQTTARSRPRCQICSSESHLARSLGVAQAKMRDFWASFVVCWASPLIIGDRLRALREEKKLSQGDIEKRTGLLRCYISRVENGHTVPAIETLEKMARAFEVPMYELF